ncbi:hypothetical protein SAMN05192529_102105 [Arachidicoccus rhizosphaerae]|uniref:PD-(D/E)XK nuclease superfamily protein n=1 Tax=Arachidicoccus rhizosphaerae TaxID=551991 RepID=A0A1H3W4A8_9BACT|nr:hypothetical protein [Arachidicoccus rhizosphaerae]SDZ81681.1 hypothetical protein SAMN05192529_102105 [Arachidicoccus rhizosphaerae]
MAIVIHEKQLEDLIFEDIEETLGSTIELKGLHLNLGYYISAFRQLRFGEYGISDIITIGFEEGSIIVNVIELKIVPFSFDHLSQLARYVKAVKEMINNSPIRRTVKIYGTLIVEQFPVNDSLYLPYILSDNIAIYSTEYGLSGVKFSKLHSNWVRGEGKLSINDTLKEEDKKELKKMLQWFYAQSIYQIPEFSKSESNNKEGPF